MFLGPAPAEQTRATDRRRRDHEQLVADGFGGLADGAETREKENTGKPAEEAANHVNEDLGAIDCN